MPWIEVPTGQLRKYKKSDLGRALIKISPTEEKKKVVVCVTADQGSLLHF